MKRNVWTSNGEDELVRMPRHVAVHEELMADVSSNVLWKRGTTALFDIIIFNLDVGSYLRKTSKKSFLKEEKEKKELYLQVFL